jgi:hypothetical protein
MVTLPVATKIMVQMRRCTTARQFFKVLGGPVREPIVDVQFCEGGDIYKACVDTGAPFTTAPEEIADLAGIAIPSDALQVPLGGYGTGVADGRLVYCSVWLNMTVPLHDFAVVFTKDPAYKGVLLGQHNLLQNFSLIHENHEPDSLFALVSPQAPRLARGL